MEDKKYICPICNKGFSNEDGIKKHSLACWRKENPHHKTKHAPHGEDVNTREINNDILNFFNSFKVNENDSKN